MSADVQPLLEARHLSVRFGRSGNRGATQAVSDVSLQLWPGEILGLVGESGSGKTTLARTLLGIQRETAGEILLDGRQVGGSDPDQARRTRRQIQYVHQDAAASLDPWWSIRASLLEALTLRGGTGAGGGAPRIDEVLDLVGLDRSIGTRYVHELSGGQLRRVALARILLLRPRVLILDEPTAGLDMSVQATVLALLTDLRARLGLTYLIISHDLGLVRSVCDRVVILYLGRIVEVAPVRRLFASPLHPYTRDLLAATLSLQPGNALDGVPSDDTPTAPSGGSGCPFQPRCAHAAAACSVLTPVLEPAGDGREVACLRWRALDMLP